MRTCNISDNDPEKSNNISNNSADQSKLKKGTKDSTIHLPAQEGEDRVKATNRYRYSHGSKKCRRKNLVGVVRKMMKSTSPDNLMHLPIILEMSRKRELINNLSANSINK